MSRRRFRLGRLPVVMIGTGFSAIPHNHFFKRPYSLNDQEIEWGWRIHSFGIDSTRAFEWCLFSLWRLPRNLWALLSTETSIEKLYKFVYTHTLYSAIMSHDHVQPPLTWNHCRQLHMKPSLTASYDATADSFIWSHCWQLHMKPFAGKYMYTQALMVPTCTGVHNHLTVTAAVLAVTEPIHTLLTCTALALTSVYPLYAHV